MRNKMNPCHHQSSSSNSPNQSGGAFVTNEDRFIFEDSSKWKEKSDSNLVSSSASSLKNTKFGAGVTQRPKRLLEVSDGPSSQGANPKRLSNGHVGTGQGNKRSYC